MSNCICVLTCTDERCHWKRGSSLTRVSHKHGVNLKIFLIFNLFYSATSCIEIYIAFFADAMISSYLCVGKAYVINSGGDDVNRQINRSLTFLKYSANTETLIIH